MQVCELKLDKGLHFNQLWLTQGLHFNQLWLAQGLHFNQLWLAQGLHFNQLGLAQGLHFNQLWLAQGLHFNQLGLAQGLHFNQLWSIPPRWQTCPSHPRANPSSCLRLRFTWPGWDSTNQERGSFAHQFNKKNRFRLQKGRLNELSGKFVLCWHLG